MARRTFIDLFCGCGGFTLGLTRAGFRCLAGIDFDREAITVYAKNFRRGPQSLQQDLTTFPPEDLANLLGGNEVDVIVGGPPCQGFSTVRQVDGANHGRRLVKDDRRLLYRYFLRYVDHFKPKVFVMENVLGIRSASDGEYFARVQQEARALGYRVHAQVEDCVELGIPQKRRRQLFVGTRLDLEGIFRPCLERVLRAPDRPTLWDAIGDLPRLKAGEGVESREYDIIRQDAHARKHGYRYLYQVLEVFRASKLTAHRARPHSARDMRDFSRLKEGESSAAAMRRGVQFEFPYDKEKFKDRYTRQHRNRACSTIVAHMSKDGLMFIHPTQNRSLTAREAARVQSFPDWFEFPILRTHQYRVIGNAVPPLVAEAVGMAVKKFITSALKRPKSIRFRLALPTDRNEAAQWLRPILDLDSRALRRVPTSQFNPAWYSIAFLYPGLHPNSALDHGLKISDHTDDEVKLLDLDPRLVVPYFEQSGWPVALGRIAKEAWRRYRAGNLKEREFYCSAAQIAGFLDRNPTLGANGDRLVA